MQSEEIIKFFKDEIPKLKNVCKSYKSYGITQLNIKLRDEGIKQYSGYSIKS